MGLKNRMWIWTGINVVWWVVSIGLAAFNIIDTNPLATNTEEVIINAIVWIAGLMILYNVEEEKKRRREEEKKKAKLKHKTMDVTE